MPANICPRVIILSFSDIRHDARVLRQIEYLADRYAVSVVGYGEKDPQLAPGVEMLPVSMKDERGWMRKIRSLVLLPLGRLWPAKAYEAWYWGRDNYKAAFDILLKTRACIIHANDWNALPVAVKAADILGSEILLDLHEYAPGQWEEHWHWRTFFKPLIDYYLRKYAHLAPASITVSQTIAERYFEEYGFRPQVVMNAPRLETDLPFRSTNPDAIRLIHHGVAQRERNLESMIQTVSFLDERFTLHFMLLDSNKGYISELKEAAADSAPGRIFFHNPIKPEKVVSVIHEYDIGFYLLPLTNFNHSAALPNKFFDFIVAGLAVCVGPSQEMGRLVNEYKIGVVTPSFEPREVAATINNLGVDDIEKMKAMSIKARLRLNADTEMARLLDIYAKISTPSNV